MPFLEDICILVWVLSIPVMGISALLFLIRLITKKNRKVVKRVFWSAVACFLGSFLLFGLTSPVTWCKHEYNLIADEAPTCTSNGRREQYCPLCDYTKKETFDATGHNMVTQSKREPTYEADGELIEKCSVCGYEEITKIDVLVKETDPTEKLVSDLEELEESQGLENLRDDPTYTLKSVDLVGIWKGRGFDSTETPYYYFAADGNIYYMTSNRKPDQSWFALVGRAS